MCKKRDQMKETLMWHKASDFVIELPPIAVLRACHKISFYGYLSHLPTIINTRTYTSAAFLLFS